MKSQIKRVVFKIGTSSLIHETGKPNLRIMELLAEVLADLMNAGIEVVLVTSGAVGVGTGKLGLPERPKDMAGKQAAATVGQCELMFTYDKMFSQYGYCAGQILIIREDIEDPGRHQNLVNTFEKLFAYHVIPIINENDAVAIEEIVYGDNDSLSAQVAALVGADALIILTDTDGLYTKNPQKYADAVRISQVKCITAEIEQIAGSSHNEFGTGGMITKIKAAQLAGRYGIDTYIISGKDPRQVYDLLDGKDVGTHFWASKGDEPSC